MFTLISFAEEFSILRKMCQKSWIFRKIYNNFCILRLEFHTKAEKYNRAEGHLSTGGK